MASPVLSVVMPVFKEGEAVEPVLRALTAAITVPHEILVVYDFDEDPDKAIKLTKSKVTGDEIVMMNSKLHVDERAPLAMMM